MGRYEINISFSINEFEFIKGQLIELPHTILTESDLKEFITRGWVIYEEQS